MADLQPCDDCDCSDDNAESFEGGYGLGVSDGRHEARTEIAELKARIAELEALVTNLTLHVGDVGNELRKCKGGRV